EQSTVKVNKAEKIGKRGFAAVATAAVARNEEAARAIGAAAMGQETLPIPTPLSNHEIASIAVEKKVVAPVAASMSAAKPAAATMTAAKPVSTVNDAMKEALHKLANHPNASPTKAAAPAPKPKLTPEQVQEMMDNFGKKPAAHSVKNSSSSDDGPVDPG